jgi:hypothetical protein
MSRLYLSIPCAFFLPLHTALRVHSAPGFPCALCQRERGNEMQNSGENAPRD